jgi:two-component system nitrogen regulation sensor histidine kinase GlnL
VSEIADFKRAAFDLGPDAALLASRHGSVLAVNEAAETLFGQHLATLLRQGLKAPGWEALGQLVQRCAGPGAVARKGALEWPRADHAGEKVAATVVALDDDTVLLTLVADHGITTAERAADSLKSAVGLGRLLAHEIKNPLAGIRGAAQLLRDGLKDEDAPLAQLIIEESDRIRRLVDRMQALAEAEPAALAPVNLHRVLERVRALAANGFADGIVVREIYDPSLPLALADEDQLMQLFLNLMRNAAEATRRRGDSQGEIVLATAYRHGAWDGWGAGAPAQAAPLEVRVTDNGPGVADSVRGRLFEPFVSTRESGGGLGLAVAARVVAAHGGRLDFESTPGRTVFRVLLPIAGQQIEAT